MAQVRELCLKYLTYDPNYNYDEEENMGGVMDLDEEESEDGEEDYSDDDDMSWKVCTSGMNNNLNRFILK